MVKYNVFNKNDKRKGRMKVFFDKLKEKMAKTKESFTGSISNVFSAFTKVDELLNSVVDRVSYTQYMGEYVPNYFTSLGIHDIAQYCGYDIIWPESKDTNWCVHPDKPLAEQLPLKIDDNNRWYKRSIELYEKCCEIFKGRIIPQCYDFHTNMDLLLSVRGDENLCYDLYDCPEAVKAGLIDAIEIFKKL